MPLRETPELSVIGVGGISQFSDMIEFWKKGGSLIQVLYFFYLSRPTIFKSNKK
jgi:dihydroorotate dehydrogenase